MTRLLISTALAGLLVSAGAALAQPDGHRGGDRGGQHEQHGGAPAQAPHPAPQAQATPPSRDRAGSLRPIPPAAQPAPQAQAAPPSRDRDAGSLRPINPPAQNRDQRGDNRSGPQNAMRGPNPGSRGPGGANRGPDHNNFTAYHRNFNAPHRFRAPGTYRRPQGWYSHHWTFGEMLPSLFWTNNYWINDYDDFALAPPPPGTVWVRDGSDALLIDRYDGQIVQVVYDVFY
jgi:Ni/Co efflux regulator RcnB